MQIRIPGGRFTQESAPEAQDLLSAMQRIGRSVHFATPIGPPGHVLCQDIDQRLHLTVLAGRQEPFDQMLLGFFRRWGETGTALTQVRFRLMKDLPAIGGALVHNLGNLLIAIGEDFAQEKDGPFIRRQALQEEERGTLLWASTLLV